MHIEPGFVAAHKVAVANAAWAGLCLSRIIPLFVRPLLIVRTLVAACFFSILMQAFHMSVGPSELHLIGASTIYFTLGFTPALLGFPLGLLLQGMLFEPSDLVHIGVNSLSLMLPLLAAHAASGRKFFDHNPDRLDFRGVATFDAIYYGGVTAMVGFWLSLGETPTPVADWAVWALCYAPFVVIEPIMTLAVVRGLRNLEGWRGARDLFEVDALRV